MKLQSKDYQTKVRLEISCSRENICMNQINSRAISGKYTVETTVVFVVSQSKEVTNFQTIKKTLKQKTHEIHVLVWEYSNRIKSFSQSNYF